MACTGLPVRKDGQILRRKRRRTEAEKQQAQKGEKEDSWTSGNYYCASNESGYDCRRCLTNLAQVRILGEDKFCEYAKDDGLIKLTDNKK